MVVIFMSNRTISSLGMVKLKFSTQVSGIKHILKNFVR